FLEYFRVKDDNKLRNVIKSILYSLVESGEMNNFNIEKVSFHFSKQYYFSHALFKKISQEYLKLLNNGKDLKFSFFIKEHEYDISDQYKGIFTEDKKHTLVIDDEFNTFFDKKVVVNHKSQCIFLMFLNTLDIKYLHIKSLKRVNRKSFCFILDNLKKKIDEIVFFWCYISDDVICSLNANLNFKNLKKIVFIESNFDTVFIFIEHLSNIEEFIFYINENYEIYTVTGIEEENLNIADLIIQSLKNEIQKYSLKESINKNEKIPKENEDFHLKLLNEDKFRDKVKIFEDFRCENNNFEVQCFYEYKGCFNNMSIYLNILNKNSFFATENTILEQTIKSISISSSVIKSDCLKDILNIKGLERLEIEYSYIDIKNEIFLNESIKYFKFWPSDSSCYSDFFQLIDMMIGLQKIYFDTTNTIKLNRFENQIFYITELDLRCFDRMIDFLIQSEQNEKFDFEATNKDGENLKLYLSPLKFLFQNYEISSIKKLSISDFYINNSDVEALCNLLSLEELNINSIKFENISFSELFLAKQEYKIKRMNLYGINISEKDLIFIANLKKIEYIQFESCYIQGNTYNEIKMSFFNENYIELKYNARRDNLPEKTIKFIKEKFNTKILLQSRRR
ncbi:hypothetical protein CWI38_2062p0010, partial [Hamiltosporidium tvaerminnensis]